MALSHAPDPDLFIRTGGEVRISNFLLWQVAYAELYFTECLWPDFDEAELDAALAAYAGRERRFGDVRAAATGAALGPVVDAMLAQRVATALVLLALWLPTLWMHSPWPFMVLTLVLISAAAWEWARLNGLAPRALVSGLVVAASGWRCAAGACGR